MVGGYLLCLGDEVILGQPSAEVDIPILADLSRRHASIRREGESYVLTPIHHMSVDGAALTGPTVLRNEALIELGPHVRMRLSKPHALSATAILTLDSHHKTEPAVDSIVLMSESCILGPREHSHIRCRNWNDDVVLFRRGEHLQLRSQASFEIDGEPADSEAVVRGNCRVEGKDFAMSFEEIGSG